MGPEKTFTVFVVDDDESVRKALKRLLKVNGYHVQTFESAEAFIASDRHQTKGCLVLDIRLPGMSGLDLYGQLVSSKVNYPVTFITAHDDPQWRQKALEMDAVAYLRKPFDQQSLLDAVQAAHSRLEDAETRIDGER